MALWCILLMAVLTLGVIISVILRYVFNISFGQSKEAITLIFIATSYFGMALGITENDHIAISYFSERLPGGLRKAVQVFVMLVIIASLFLPVVPAHRGYAADDEVDEIAIQDGAVHTGNRGTSV
ncbi:MAG: TRAP transporter small permease subunit [Spirochaetota bacterium]